MANNIGKTFDWSSPSFEPPDLPDPNTIASLPCSLGGDRGELPAEFAEPHEGDLDALHDLAERHGYLIGDGKPESIFRQPDSIKKAAAQG
jgi:hypothetical protein